MNATFKSFLVHHGARFDDPLLLGFGPDASPALNLSDAQLVPLTHLAVLRVSGADAVTFLHNLATNDVRALTADQWQHNALCSPKGRMLASFLMWQQNDEHFMLCSAELVAGIAKKLSMYVLRSKVVVRDVSDDFIALGLIGAASTQWLSSQAALPADTPHAMVSGAPGVVLRQGANRFVLITPAAQAETLAESAIGTGLKWAGTSVWEWFDIEAGIPRITAATQEEFVPQMANFDLIGGVNFKKGCYPGQEIVARTQYLGKLKKRLYRAHLEEGQPAPGMPLFGVDFADQACGIIANAAPAPGGGFDVLAVIQMSSVEAGPVSLGTPGGPTLSWLPLPYALPT